MFQKQQSSSTQSDYINPHSQKRVGYFQSVHHSIDNNRRSYIFKSASNKEFRQKINKQQKSRLNGLIQDDKNNKTKDIKSEQQEKGLGYLSYKTKQDGTKKQFILRKNILQRSSIRLKKDGMQQAPSNSNGTQKYGGNLIQNQNQTKEEINKMQKNLERAYNLYEIAIKAKEKAEEDVVKAEKNKQKVQNEKKQYEKLYIKAKAQSSPNIKQIKAIYQGCLQKLKICEEDIFQMKKSKKQRENTEQHFLKLTIQKQIDLKKLKDQYFDIKKKLLNMK